MDPSGEAARIGRRELLVSGARAAVVAGGVMSGCGRRRWPSTR